MYRRGESYDSVHYCEECQVQAPTGCASWVQAPSASEGPRNPSGTCDGCGVLGTIALVTRVTTSVVKTRYCRTCWPGVRVDLERERAQRLAERPRVRLRDRARDGPRLPQQSLSWSSASWDDAREFLELVRKAAPHSETPVDYAELARDLASRAPDMDGPMPPDLAQFVREHGGAD